uniref:Pacifastin domain-containing protein n=1 Tax=Arion vulgaris TaxID=1028688 RepID=A0A0B7AP54_9EUPU
MMFVRSQRLIADYTSGDACVTPKDERCICGIDGVPSCTAEVIDINSYPAVTVQRISSLSSSSNVISPRTINSARTYERDRNSLEENLPNQVERLERYSTDPTVLSKDIPRTVNPHILDNHLNKYSTEQHSVVTETTYGTQAHRQTGSDVTDVPLVTESDQRSIAQNYFHPVNVEDSNSRPNLTNNTQPEHTNLSVGHFLKLVTDAIKDKRVKNILQGVSVGDHSKNVGESSLQIPGNIDDRNRKITTDSSTSTQSFLIASTNSCRFGTRWYGGSLRCHCGLDNSIICGDPSFVATEIDRFRLNRSECTQGHTWKEDDSCTVCECQISGVALCWQSSSCLLPFLIKPLSETTSILKDVEISGKVQHSDWQTEVAGKKKENLILNRTGDKSVTKLLSHKKEDLELVSLENTNSDDISGDGEVLDRDTTSGMVDLTESKIIVNEVDGSGKIRSQVITASLDVGKHNQTDFDTSSDTSTVDLSTNFRSLVNISVYSGENSGSSGSVKSETQKGNSNIKSENIESNSVQADSDNKGSYIKETVTVARPECKLKSRWIDGCKRCLCNQDGKKECDDRRCPKAMPISVDTPTPISDCGDKSNPRPVQCPPAGPVSARDHPIAPQEINDSSKLCGRFKPGDEYWDDCNMCLCTPVGPKCTAKNCA